MTDDIPKTERKLSRTGDKQTLQGVVGDDVDDLDVFGYEVIYTTGEFLIDRESLLNKATEVGIPEWMLPSETAPHHAFGYAIDDLLDGREEVEIDGHRVRYVVDKNDSRYSYSVDARVYFPPEMTQTDDGIWRDKRLGVIKYDNPDNGEPRVRFIDRIDPEETLAPHWGRGKVDGEEVTDGMENYETREQALRDGSLRARMEALFEQHKDSHRGKDVNNMTYYLVDQWTDSIKLRDACYFVPANHTYGVDVTETIDVSGQGDPEDIASQELDRFPEGAYVKDVMEDGSQDGNGAVAVVAYTEQRPIEDLIDAFSALYDWLDEHAQKPKYAQHTEMNVVEIMDTDRQRDMVERKVQRRLEDMAEGMAENVIESMQDDDTVAEEVASEVSEAMDNLRAVAGEYDDLLDGGKKADLKTKNAVKRAVKQALGDLNSDEQELAEAVLEETEVDV